ncbi:ABC transporter permease [Mesorhizobium sp. B292B1B]|uniref:ABC transporter permease n=1 Tax=unclassified Mesorhizobium TaxID=325217 RepID=UPI001127D54F|nr:MULTISPECIES: ABC transporter permease [unclassified Mesorhizobium]MCA0014388.1 ABC transporter permease [Mesorhizobium sp. B294B1A1]MCA0036451.1 ABC transporter permease [Mesorhizobium sp. B292B1B]TPM24955.1 ABC transporter permease [Mesorhizobium sp. B2-2-2]TPM42151.1 ABC transporter permease [Mesorhizobium sp. B2-3-2]
MRKLPFRLVLGLTLLVIITLIAVFAPLIAPLHPTATTVNVLGPPSAENILGTDQLGRDVLSRVIYGTRVSLQVGASAAIVAVLIGAPIGLIAGFFRGWIDFFLVQIIDIFIALPGLVLALIITAMLGPSVVNLAVTLGVVTAPTVARLVRGQVFVVREMVFVEAARATGASSFWIIRHHIMPNTMRVVWAQFAINVAFAIFTSASLSFLGLGVPPPAPDWGGMVRDGSMFLPILPLLSLGPGAAVALTVFTFYLVGSSMNEAASRNDR